jgi:hypothetical protein
LLYCPPRKSKREIKIKKKTLQNPPYQKKNQPAILHGLRKPGGQARKQKTMRSTTKLGTKNKPISFKIDFEIFFCKNKNQPPSLQSALHLTPIKRKNKNEF